MIRSTKLSMKFANVGKRSLIANFIDTYKLGVQQYVDLIWDMDKIPSLLPKEITDKCTANLTARAKQAAGKQASAIVRGTKTKQNKRLFVINKLKEQGKLEDAARLQKIYDETKVSKPNVERLDLLLDNRFVQFKEETESSFDAWIVLGSCGFGKINLPVKKTKHFNKLKAKGKLLNSVYLSKDYVTLCFEADRPKNNGTKTIGIDIGCNKVISCSNGHQTVQNKHLYDLNKIIDLLKKKKPGSKQYRKVLSHKKNFINWAVNQLDLSDVQVVQIERILNMRKGRKRLGKLNNWTYRNIFSKIESRCEEANVLVRHINPAYTSKRCFKCGFVHKDNRHGEEFKCVGCGYAAHADLNAAMNISLTLPQICGGVSGDEPFYWRVEEQEPIVPAGKKYVLKKVGFS
jgi:IS605 OrfB family transposase